MRVGAGSQTSGKPVRTRQWVAQGRASAVLLLQWKLGQFAANESTMDVGMPDVEAEYFAVKLALAEALEKLKAM